MTQNHTNNYPKLHNSVWPGLVGKGDGGEPAIDLDTMIELTAAAEVEGAPVRRVRHLPGPAALRHRRRRRGGPAAGRQGAGQRAANRHRRGAGLCGHGRGLADRRPPGQKKFLGQVRKGLPRGQLLRQMGRAAVGSVRMDSVCSVEQWSDDPKGNQRRIAETFREACAIAEDHGERLAAEGEICWGGMHSWPMIELLEMVDRRQTLGFQADMSHTLLYLLGYNSPEDALLPPGSTGATGPVRRGLRETHRRPAALDDRLPRRPKRRLGLRRRLARQDRPPLPGRRPRRKAQHRPPRRLLAPRRQRQADAGHGHICWDGCMFPNAVLLKRETWNEVLRAMAAVRDAARVAGSELTGQPVQAPASIAGFQGNRENRDIMRKANVQNLRIAVLGCGFMGRAHSNAWLQVGHFFPDRAQAGA